MKKFFSLTDFVIRAALSATVFALAGYLGFRLEPFWPGVIGTAATFIVAGYVYRGILDLLRAGYMAISDGLPKENIGIGWILIPLAIIVVVPLVVVAQVLDSSLIWDLWVPLRLLALVATLGVVNSFGYRD